MNSYSFSLVLKRSILAISLFAVSPFGWSATNCNLVTEIPQEECLALLDLYNSTNGPNWKNKTGWNETDTPCSWYGIKCDGGQVYNLNLSGNQLSGTLPNSLGGLSQLTALSLGVNQLTGTLPDSLGNLNKLDHLALDDNQLTGPIPESLGNLNNLTTLFLSINQLTGLIPNSLGNLSKLKLLVLYDNQLTGPIPDSFGNLSNLIVMELSNNQLCSDIPNTISSLQNLQECLLSNNYLTATDPTLIQFLDANCTDWKTQNPPPDDCPTTSHYTLTIEKTGEGTITATGIDCGSDCSEEYPANSTITLTTQAAPNFEFIQWGGDCGDNFELELTLPITKNLNCTALFETRFFPEHTITLNKTGSGNGTLSLTVNNQTTTCQPSCTQTAAHQSQITLQAIPDDTSDFVGFFGQGCSSSWFLTEDRVCEARFESLPRYTLTVTKSGQGSGRVTSEVGKLDCGDNCIRSYLSGTSVTLTAIPDAGSTFLAWSQDCNSATTKASVSIYRNTTCNAQFGIAGTPQLTLDHPLVDFVQTNSLAKHTLTITNTGKGGLRIENLELADTSIFQINKDNCANNVLIPDGSCTVTLQFQPPATTVATYQTQLEITSNDPQSPTVVDLQGQSCSHDATAHRSLTANPYRLDFGIEAVGNRVSRQQRFDMWTTGCTSLDLDTLTLKGRHANEFKILDKQCYYGHWQQQAQASCLFTVEFHPTSAGIKDVRPVITYTDPSVSMPSYYWTAQAISEGQPQLELSATEHDFGTLTLGKAIPSWTLTLTNRGTTNLTFSRIQLDSDEFKVYDSYCTFLVPQQSCSLLVQLTPATLGDKSAQLTLTYNETTVEVPLTAVVTGPADCSPEQLTIETSGQSPLWEDPVAWQRLKPGAELPSVTDVVRIKSGHVLVGLPLIQVKALCIDNHAVLLSRDDQGSTLEIQATDYFQNQGDVLGLDGANNETETCTTHCAKPGASVIIKVGSQLNRQGKMGDWWWYGEGGPIVNLGRIQAGNGGSSENYGAPGGDALVLGRNTTNQGVIQAGQGGHVLGIGAGQAGRGGLTQIWGKLGGPGYLYNQNGAKALAGDGGYCNPAAIEPQTGGDGGNLWLVSLPEVYLNNGIYRAGKGSPYCQPKKGQDGFVQIEPSVIDLTGAQTHVSGGDVTIFGGNNWILDLSNMASPFLEATGNITLAVGPGGIIDLRHNQTPIMKAHGQVNLFADTILIDEGTTLSNLITASAIVVGPNKVLSDVNLVGSGSLFGQPQTTVLLSFTLSNNSPQTDTYLLTLTATADWPLSLGESQITVAGLNSILVTPQLTLPQELGAGNTITMTVSSQTDPRVQATAQVNVTVTDQPPRVTTTTLQTELAEKSITGITTLLDTGLNEVSESSLNTATSNIITEENESSVVNLTPENEGLASNLVDNAAVTEIIPAAVETPIPLEPATFLSDLPNNTCPLNADFINWPCDNRHQTLQGVTFGPQASVAGGLLQGHLENQGWLSQVTIAPAAQVIGGKLTGDVINQGTLINIQFVGRTVTGGTLQGVIDNQSQIGGTFIDVKLAANTVLKGGAVAGQISGDCQAPARLEHLIIQPRSQVKCVILGEDITLLEEVTLQDVQIVVSPAALSLEGITSANVTLPHLEAIAFDKSAQSLSTPALLAGGVSVNSEPFQHYTEMTATDLVKLYGQIQVEPKHIGQPGEIVVYGHYKPTTVEMEPVDFILVRDKLTGKSQVKIWNGDLAKLEAFEQLAALPAVYLAPLYEDFLKVASGQVIVFMGYRIVTFPDQGILVQNQNGIELVIREREE